MLRPCPHLPCDIDCNLALQPCLRPLPTSLVNLLQLQSPLHLPTSVATHLLLQPPTSIAALLRHWLHPLFFSIASNSSLALASQLCLHFQLRLRSPSILRHWSQLSCDITRFPSSSSLATLSHSLLFKFFINYLILSASPQLFRAGVCWVLDLIIMSAHLPLSVHLYLVLLKCMFGIHLACSDRFIYILCLLEILLAVSTTIICPDTCSYPGHIIIVSLVLVVYWPPYPIYFTSSWYSNVITLSLCETHFKLPILNHFILSHLIEYCSLFKDPFVVL